ncbi:MAG: amino acid permease, partial [Candidatus Thermoplasmatota archaeon]|nr:amino acid permease [Candidatus Thermoplasmatota archaeon]
EIVSVGALVATSGVILTGILGTSRVMFAMGRDREMPSSLSRLDRFSTPILAIIVSVLLAVAMMPLASFGTIVEASNTCVLSAYFIINIAAIKTHMKYVNVNKTGGSSSGFDKFYLIPIAGMVSIFIFFVFLGLESIIIAGIVFVVASSYYIIRVKLQGRGRVIPSHSKVRLFGKSRAP